MSNDGGGAPPASWKTAVALTLAVLLLSAFNALPLVALPLAILLVALPGERRWKTLGVAAVVWVVALGLSGSALGAVSRGWALMLGSAFLFTTVLRPSWGVLSRSLMALALSLGVGGAAVGLSGRWARTDGLLREHFAEAARLAVEGLSPGAPGSAFGAEFAVAIEKMGTLQWSLFPAVLGLQSLAALALASWWIARLRRPGDGRFHLRRLRDFRFNDQLIWVLIVGMVVVALPLGVLTTRLGYNALFFMGGLYALRGVGVIVFLASGAPPVFAIGFGVLAAIFLYPLVLTTAILVGLGDTWLDVRGRAALAPRA